MVHNSGFRGTAGGQRLRLRDALEQAGDGCRAGAAKYAGRPSPSPQPPSSPALRERKGEGEHSSGNSASKSVNETVSPNQLTPIPHCGRGRGRVGGEKECWKPLT